MKIIADLWRYAYAAYDPKPDNPVFHGGLVEEFRRGCMGYAFGIIEPGNDRVVIAFRGTVGNVRDWLRNIKFLPNNEGVHTGFYDEWLMFASDITEFVKSALAQRASRVYFCGHSQGGATAIVASKAVSDALGVPASCITFGAPKAGNKDYRNAANISPLDITNVINGYDIVTTMPFDSVGARQPGKTYWLHEPFWHKVFCKIADHLPVNYDTSIKREMKKRAI